ncbi:MAG TPA: DnaJ domain-containing protein [Dehalococcoidia bacterium]|nr:DnaJ domain-containing protein [Dehalococcoidia bacterium]
MKAQEYVDGHGSPTAADDHYRLLQLDPDAPQQLVAEAYWFLASRLRSEKRVRRSAERELVTLNAAYQVLAVAEQRRAYDATVTRVLEIRRQRAEKSQSQQRRSLQTRLFKKSRRPQVDFYELLRVDPTAELPLMARAYSILRTIHSKEPSGEPPEYYLAELEQARVTLLDRGRRAAYDESRAQAAAAMTSSSETEAKPAKNAPRAAVKEEPAIKPAVRVLSKSLAATAKGSGRLAFAAGRLGYRGLTRAARDGGRGAAVALKAGGRNSQRLRHRQSPTQATGELPDERLLRDATPVAARTKREQPEGRCLARLIVCNPAGEEETFELGEEPVTLGSDRECDLRLPAESGAIAPAHAQLWFTGERFVIRSLDPIYPTILCGQRVNWAGLDDGDEIEIGPHRLRFEVARAWDTPPHFLTVEHDAAADAEEIPERHE